MNGTLENQETIEITSTGSINTSDTDSGTFRYSTGGGTIPALLGYNDLGITDGTWSATDALTVGGALTVNGTANASFNAGAGGQATEREPPALPPAELFPLETTHPILSP